MSSSQCEGLQGEPQIPLPQASACPHPLPAQTQPCPRSLQVPIHALWNDGRENLLGALLLAGQYVVPEVPTLPGDFRGLPFTL